MNSADNKLWVNECKIMRDIKALKVAFDSDNKKVLQLILDEVYQRLMIRIVKSGKRFDDLPLLLILNAVEQLSNSKRDLCNYKWTCHVFSLYMGRLTVRLERAIAFDRPQP